MPANLQTINSFPHDYITNSATGIYNTTTTSLNSVSQSGEILAQAFNTNDKTLCTSTGNTTVVSLPDLVYYYDFGTQGGAVSNVVLKGPVIPAGYVIEDAAWHPTTAFTSGGSAQISLGTATGTPANILAAAVLGTNGTTGKKACIPDFATAGDAILVSTATLPVIGITVAALTAGAGVLRIRGYLAVADTVL
jgi:hypothetical protein